MIDEQVVMEIGRVFIASGNLEHRIRGYLSLTLNDRFAEIGQATVCKIKSIHDCLDLFEVVCQIRAFSKWEELGDLKERINADKVLRNLLAHASFHEDSEGVALLDVIIAYDIKKIINGKRKPITRLSFQKLQGLSRRVEGYHKEMLDLFAEGRFRRK